jgi:dethiobiotin synthetase
LCHLVAPDIVILVADAGLGTINAVRLSAGALRDGGAPVVVHLNRYDAADDLHQRNRDWLAHRDQLDVVISVGELVHRVLERPGGGRRD